MSAFEAVFRDALIYDGTGAPPWQGDVAIESDRIVAVEAPGVIAKCEDEIDAMGSPLRRASSMPTPTMTASFSTRPKCGPRSARA